MKRWAVCKVGDYEGDGSRSPKITQYTPNWRAWTAPAKAWSFVQFAADDLTAIQADNEIHILPDATLDATWGTIGTAIRNAIVTKLTAAGFDTGSIKTAWTIRQVLVYLAGQIQPLVNLEAGDVVDL
jgi:hypothetical protein